MNNTAAAAAVRDEEKRVLICPVCGTENDPYAEECVNCGQRFRDREPSFARPGSFAGATRIEISLSEKIDGVPIKDYLVYLGTGSLRNIIAFKRQQESGKKIGMSLLALLSPVLFFVYYKMWLYAVPMTLLTLLLNFPSFVVMYLGETATSFLGFTMQQWNSAGNICYFVLMAIQLVCALFSIYMLRTSSAKAIKKLRRECDNEEDYARLLARKACPSVLFYVLMGMTFVSLLGSLLIL